MAYAIDTVQAAPAAQPAPVAEPSSATPPPAITTLGAGDETQTVDDVVVVAERPAVLNQIDRRIYEVGRDPAAQTSPVIEILEKVPSVSVDPSGRLRLLGQSNVTVLIDGQKPVNEQAVLRSLTGADIDRIEVMTNPGVQYGPVGTGGIINIITKRRTTPGVTGTMATTVDTRGAARFTVSPILTRDRWTLTSNLSLSGGQQEDRSSVSREVFATPVTAVVVTDEFRTGETDDRSASGALKIDYRLSENRSLNGGVEVGYSFRDGDQLGRFVSADMPTTNHLERIMDSSRYDSAAVTFGYSRTGPRDGEELTLAARIDDADIRQDRLFASDYGVGATSNSVFRTIERSGYDNESLKLDYKRPLDGGRIVTAGLNWARDGRSLERDVQVLNGSVSASAQRLDSVRTVTAAYATIQVERAGFTILPGLRLEYQNLDVGSTGLIDGDSGFDLYPSLHVSRSLGDDLALNLSYSLRIDRPDGWLLDPVPTYSRTLEAFRGNPDLGPQTTDSFEVKLDYTRPRYSLGANLYAKETRDLWTPIQTLFPDGVALSTIINAGRGASRGLELSARGKLGERFSYVATTNLFARTQRVLEASGVGDRTSFVYSGNGQLEYAAAAQDGMEADKIQLAITWYGPQRFLETESDAWFGANLTWRHPVSKRATAVLVVRNAFNNAGSRSRTVTGTFAEASRYDNQGTELRVSLTWRLGVLP